MITDLVVCNPQTLPAKSPEGPGEITDRYLPVQRAPEAPMIPSWQPLEFKFNDYVETWTQDHNLWMPTNHGYESTYTESAELFMVDQYMRFKVNPPRQDLLIWCWETAFYYVTSMDQNALFGGQSIVKMVNDNKYYQYAIKNGSGIFCEIKSDQITVYRLNRGFLDVFESIYRNPGLQYCFKGVKFHLDSILHSREEFDQMAKFYRQYKKMTYDLIHLGIWSALIWMIKPDNTMWRYKNNVIFQSCYDHTECIVYWGNVYWPSEYRRLARAAHSCSRCGIRSGCIRVYDVNHRKNILNENPTIQINGVEPGSYMLCARCTRDQIQQHTRCHNMYCVETGCKHHPNPSLNRRRAMS